MRGKPVLEYNWVGLGCSLLAAIFFFLALFGFWLAGVFPFFPANRVNHLAVCLEKHGLQASGSPVQTGSKPVSWIVNVMDHDGLRAGVIYYDESGGCVWDK